MEPHYFKDVAFDGNHQYLTPCGDLDIRCFWLHAREVHVAVLIEEARPCNPTNHRRSDCHLPNPSNQIAAVLDVSFSAGKPAAQDTGEMARHRQCGDCRNRDCYPSGQSNREADCTGLNGTAECRKGTAENLEVN